MRVPADPRCPGLEGPSATLAPGAFGALNPTLAQLLSHCGFDRTWVRGEGVWLTDASGRRFLDLYAQYGAVALGHNAGAVVAAVQEALGAAEPAMVQPYRAPWAEALADELARLSGLARCVFTTSGAEAVEAAIKLARARSRRQIILSAHGSFHGKTLGALAATGQRHHAEGFGPPPPGFDQVPFGDAEALAGRLERDERDGGRIAAFLLEPIQGERGVHLPPPGYLGRARELCTRHGVALILDEVQTGLGRTGRLFAYQHDDLVPDILLLAKGLGGGLFPLGACLSSAAWWDEGFALRHSSTFANNNIACRVGMAVLSALTRDGLCAEAARKGERLAAGLAALAARYPGAVAGVRTRGLYGAVELRPVGDDAGSFLSYLCHQGLYAYAVAAALAERAAVLVLPSLGSANVLRLAPPLIIRDEEIDLGLSALESVCALLQRRDAAALARAIGATDRRHLARAGARPQILLPSPPATGPVTSGPAYAFLVHYTRPEDVVVNDPALGKLSAEELQAFRAFAAALPAGVVLRAPAIRSATGAIAEGWIIALPILPREMARRGRRRVRREIMAAVDLAASLGALVVGLGGFTTPYSRRGLDAVGRGPAITTGNTLTALMAIEALRTVAARRGQALAEARLAVVGARGSVGALCARLAARERPRRLVLLGRPSSGASPLVPLQEELCWGPDTVEVTTDLGRLAGCDLIVSASGAPRPVLDGAPLQPGTVICDVARPHDASPRVRARGDLTVIDGGLVALPDPAARFGAGNLQGLPDGVQLACLSETILLCLAGEPGDHGVGDHIPVETADRVQALAARHGFRLAAPSRDGQPLYTPIPPPPPSGDRGPIEAFVEERA